MTEPIRTPAPEGLKRLIRVSTIQCGSDFVRQKLDSKALPLKELVSGILRNEDMSTRELVGCLLSEPYNVLPTELDMIALVLDSLNEDGLLRVGFRVHNDNFDIEPTFQVI